LLFAQTCRELVGVVTVSCTSKFSVYWFSLQIVGWCLAVFDKHSLFCL